MHDMQFICINIYFALRGHAIHFKRLLRYGQFRLWNKNVVYGRRRKIFDFLSEETAAKMLKSGKFTVEEIHEYVPRLSIEEIQALKKSNALQE